MWKFVELGYVEDMNDMTREAVQRYGGVSLAEPYGFQRVECPVG